MMRLQTFCATLDFCGEWHIIKVIKVEANSPLAHPKGKTPSRSCNLRKGVLFSAYGPSAIRQATCNGDDRRQWRKQGGAVGAAASRMRAAAKQTLGAATRAPLIKWAGKAAKQVYHKHRQKDTGNDAACQSLPLWEQRRRPPPLHTSFPPRIHSHQSKDRKGASPWS